MRPLCYELLDGTLPLNTDIVPTTTTIINHLPIAIYGAYGPSTRSSTYVSGLHWDFKLPPNSKVEMLDVAAGYYVINSKSTGGLIDVIKIEAPANKANQEFTFDTRSLSVPNDLGPIPEPTAKWVRPPPAKPVGLIGTDTIIVPPDSRKICVGVGSAPNGNQIIREQFWARQGDSMCLSPHEERTISYTVSTGRQDTSSDTTTVAQSLSSSVSAGWGPVSASISASLSTSTTHFQQVTVTEQTTTYISQTIKNPHPEAIAYIRWQIVDVVTVIAPVTGDPIASLVQSLSPSIVLGPYWVTEPKEKPPGLSDGHFEYGGPKGKVEAPS